MEDGGIVFPGISSAFVRRSARVPRAGWGSVADSVSGAGFFLVAVMAWSVEFECVAEFRDHDRALRCDAVPVVGAGIFSVGDADRRSRENSRPSLRSAGASLRSGGQFKRGVGCRDGSQLFSTLRICAPPDRRGVCPHVVRAAREVSARCRVDRKRSPSELRVRSIERGPSTSFGWRLISLWMTVHIWCERKSQRAQARWLSSLL